MTRRGSVLSIFYDFDASRRITALIITPEPVFAQGEFGPRPWELPISSSRVATLVGADTRHTDILSQGLVGAAAPRTDFVGLGDHLVILLGGAVVAQPF